MFLSYLNLGRQGIPAFAILLLLCTCGQRPYYEKTVEIKNARWSETDTVRFSVLRPDTGSRYSLGLGFRIGHTYPFSNLYVIFLSRFPDGRFAQDTLQFILADKQGKPAGRCSGRTCDYNFILKPRLHFPLPGDYSFEVVQLMRTADGYLPDVRALYLRLDRVKSESSLSR
jgi:gliding motility-associated lipoprotein GldH